MTKTGDGMLVAKTVVDDRWRRYCEGHDKEFPNYPAGCITPADWRLARRFLSALDVVVLLLPEDQIERLMSFLGHLYWNNRDFLPADMLQELSRLKQDQFVWLVARQCALVLECHGTFEEMAECWFRSPQAARGRLIDGGVYIEASADIPDPNDLVENVMNIIVHGVTGLTAGEVDSLSDQLDDARASIDAEENQEAVKKLMGFIVTVKQQVKAGKLNTATGDVIVYGTNAILAALSSNVRGLSSCD